MPRRFDRAFALVIAPCAWFGCSRDGGANAPEHAPSGGATGRHATAVAAPATSATTEAAPAVSSAATPAPHDVRYLALGDSFTAGTGARPEESFPARLADRWRTRGAKVALRNVAVNGYTTQDLIDRELPEVASFHPTFVTVAIGANDIVHGSTVEQYRAQVRVILSAVTRAVAARDVLALPQPDWSRSPSARQFGAPTALAASIERFNRILADEATATGGRYVDLFPRMREEASRGWVAPDGLHPSAAAYDEWAADLAVAIPLD